MLLPAVRIHEIVTDGYSKTRTVVGNQWFGTHWNKNDKAKDSHLRLTFKNEINFVSYGN